MAYKTKSYKPNKKGRPILARAWEHVQSVPYQVTARWLFYRLLQDGMYQGKKGYQNFLSLTSRARHGEWEGWRPDTLTDDTRQEHEHERGFASVDEWAEGVRAQYWRAKLDHWYKQEHYLECWFEATAMYRQFEYYTSGVTLRPFGGMPSIDYKHRAAKSLEADAGRYGLPVVILCFGDYDDAGQTIPETSVADIRKWCEVDFEFIRCGLNEGDGERFGIPENFEKPGQYQWEALPDDVARKLITSNVARFVDASMIDKCEAEGSAAGAKLRAYLQTFAP
jgi:hypothetical protein